jgi:hypothetical protein
VRKREQKSGIRNAEGQQNKETETGARKPKKGNKKSEIEKWKRKAALEDAVVQKP